ncbi:hypothetical protein S40285_01665 [Stachybotrys chlorohalonatus IBT 40285]|uniref:Uncharacterized protein n=1 Tax=Stachybotrys chlorohalonatus (strain IBT 40285) TaxID=1283841 RepID=A0A084QDX3_STAC4|nr:hypothetical protein S40285_01665 [Stachybotrys chlorohalonata IBT 40285]
MEDPWGSPWTSNSPPKIDLPTPPPSAHFSLENHNHSQQQRAPAIRSPWEEDDAWGGWNDAASGREGDAWTRRRSPSLRPSSGATSRQPSPSPWGSFTKIDDEPKQETSVDKINVGNGAKSKKPFDSVRSLGRELRQDEPPSRTPDDTSPEAQDVTTTGKRQESQTVPWEKRASSPELVAAEVADTTNSLSEASVDIPKTQKSPSQASKVQVLVDHYDGIAKRNVSSASLTKPAVDEAQVREEDGVSATVDPDPDDTPKLPINHWEAQHRATSALEEANDDVIPHREEKASDASFEYEEPRARSRRPSAKARMYFDIDLSKVDDLFPNTEADFPPPEPVPDVVIDDTFASISERKAWYRISRFGSIRRHNYGDDENYSTVTWNKSEVRNKAIRIVRRWMEEDSIAGRVVLGRRTGAVGAAMFNWDSKAPSVEIGELLARHSRDVSVNPKVKEASPTLPAFGWSQTPSTPACTPPNRSHLAQHARTASANLAGPSQPIASPVKQRFSLQARTTKSQTNWDAAPTTQTNGHAVEDPPLTPVQDGLASQEADKTAIPPYGADEDDEWGDMVGSSAVEGEQTHNGDAPDDFGDTPKPAGFMENPVDFINVSRSSQEKIITEEHAQPNTESQKPMIMATKLQEATFRSDGHDMAPIQDQAASPISPPLFESTQPTTTVGTYDLASPQRALTIIPEAEAGSQPANEEDQAENAPELIAAIMKSMPDLSYMLR